MRCSSRGSGAGPKASSGDEAAGAAGCRISVAMEWIDRKSPSGLKGSTNRGVFVSSAPSGCISSRGAGHSGASISVYPNPFALGSKQQQFAPCRGLRAGHHKALAHFGGQRCR